MRSETAEIFQNLVKSVQYDENAFTVWYGNEKISVGAFIHDQPEIQRFFDYATIYHTLLDLDRKIKTSFQMAIEFAEDADFDHWNPISPPSERESTAIYYLENAIFRTMVLWDLLAQFFNLKEKIDKPFDKVYSAQIFHDAQQGKRPNPFAKEVYAYMTQEDSSETEPWEGNHGYVREFRDKMIHRSTPTLSSISNLSFELRMPVAYTLKRTIEDYIQVSYFLHEIITNILQDYEMLNI